MQNERTSVQHLLEHDLHEKCENSTGKEVRGDPSCRLMRYDMVQRCCALLIALFGDRDGLSLHQRFECCHADG